VLSKTPEELGAMTPIEYRDLVVPLMNAISTRPFPKRSGPFGILGRWLKSYSRKRIYGVLVSLYKEHKRTPTIVPLVTAMLKEYYSENVEYEVLDQSDEARYGG
jgi:hypothetical protein